MQELTLDKSAKLQELKPYLDAGYSFIPMDGKKLVSSKSRRDWAGEFSRRQPTGKEAEDWAARFNYFALLSGSGLGMLDVDGKPKELRGLDPTASHSTPTRGHFRLVYTMTDPIPSQRINDTLELFGQGGTCWAIAPPSPGYEWRIPLSHIQPFPLEKLRPYLSPFTTPWPTWTYHGHDRDCIGQIMRRPLEASQERNNALFVLGFMLLRAGNDQSYMERVIREKNTSLRSPLSSREVGGILRSLERNHYDCAGCKAVKTRLRWVNCQQCLVRERRLHMSKEGRLLRSLDELKGDTTAIAVLAYILADDLEPPYNISELARRAELTRDTTREKVQKLQERGFLPLDSRSRPLSF